VAACRRGGIKFEITGPLLSPMNCHCSQCRKQHGAAFRSRARVAASDFRWVAGEHLIKYYESPRGYQRGFCRACSSPIINRAGQASNRSVTGNPISNPVTGLVPVVSPRSVPGAVPGVDGETATVRPRLRVAYARVEFIAHNELEPIADVPL
jgi:hypothetical protein